MKTRFPGAAFAVVVSISLAAPLSRAAGTSSDKWLHVLVEGRNGKAETVRVNLPLSLAEKIVPIIQDEKLQKGRLKLGSEELSGIDLQKVWDTVRSSQDAEYVTVESEGQKIRVAKSGEYLLVKADESREKPSKVEVRIPLSVVDALLSGPRGELNLQAAIEALGATGDGDLVTVADDENDVRIWIDRRNSSK